MSEMKEDKPALNRLLQDLGNAIVPSLSPNWIKVVVGYFIETESKISHFQLFVLNAGDDDYTDVVKESWNSEEFDDAIVDAEELCKRIHEFCCEVGDDWSSMSFMVERDGTYNVDYSYDPINSYDARYILDWQSTYLA